MRASKQEQTAGAGVSEVSAKFQRINWGPVPINTHDLGTDLLVQARDRRRFDRGLIVGVQVKAGRSYFREPELNSSEEVAGWWYREPGRHHFDDWVTHCLPHLLVLHDLESQTSYWAHVTADSVVGTGKGCRVLVPSEQTIDEAHVDELLAVAATQRASPPLEGTAFGASAGSIPPGRRLRHALLAPRLVAPHRNTGYESAISPEEALALCAQGRFVDYIRFSGNHSVVPNPQERYSGPIWRWNLVQAFWDWAASDDLAGLERVFETAHDPEGRAAAGVLVATALLRAERHLEALDLLKQLISHDDLSPVDHGWVLVQLSRIHGERGDTDQAQNDCVEAQRSLSANKNDVTASELASTAAWQLYTLLGWQGNGLDEALTASDTAVAWWRSQTRSWALSNAALRAFRTWAHDTKSRWSVEDTEAINLFAAELNADLCGEHDAWRAEASLAARQEVMAGHESGDLDVLSASLVALRRCGDQEALKLSFQHLRSVGPIEAVEIAVNSISTGRWTVTTAGANLEALRVAGDLAAPSNADAWITMLVTILVDPSSFEAETRPSFLTAWPVARAILGLLPAASPAGRRSAAEYLASQTGPFDEMLENPLSLWAQELRNDYLVDSVRDGLQVLAASDQGQVGAAALAWLATHGAVQAKHELRRRALAGDLHALSSTGKVTAFSAPEVKPLIERFSSMAERTIANAESSIFAHGGIDGARELALFNLWFPAAAQWEPVLELLLHPNVAPENKQGTLRLLVALQDRVPDDVRARLGAGLDVLRAPFKYADSDDRSLNGLLTSVGIATREVRGKDAEIAIAKLAMGTEQDRGDAAELLGHGWIDSMRPLLASLNADSHPSVRRTAARAVGRLASQHADPMVDELAKHLAKDQGAVVPHALLVGLNNGDQSSRLGRTLATDLTEHPSARVRSLANEYLAQTR